MIAIASPQAFLFDLDGTLVDTAPDMGAALNRLLSEQGLRELTDAAIRPHVSHGTRGLLRLGFATSPEDAAYGALRDRFLTLYEERVATSSRLFAGVEALLSRIEARSLPWGIVTNKPGYLTAPLLEQLELSSRAVCVISGDTLPVAKPHPEPLLRACECIAVAPRHCLYVGDAERDVIAAQRAGMPAVVAGYGYLGPSDQPQRWGADAIIEHPSELLRWIDDR